MAATVNVVRFDGREFPEYEAYQTPEFFQSDWLNEFLDEQGWERGKECDDYRFVYIGPKHSWYTHISRFLLPLAMRNSCWSFVFVLMT